MHGQTFSSMPLADRYDQTPPLMAGNRPFLSGPLFFSIQRQSLQMRFLIKRNYSMDADYEIFEIVAVIRDHCLIDAESYQRRYNTRHGQPLAPGYYVVNWPDDIQTRRFNEQAAFHGPFTLRKEAQAARDWMYQEREQALQQSFEKAPKALVKPVRRDMKKALMKRWQPITGSDVTQTVGGVIPLVTGLAMSGKS